MRRPFDWYGLTLPAILVVGGAALGIAALGGGLGFAAVGWILLGVGLVGLPFWLIAIIRSRTLLARAKREPGVVRFIGTVISERRSAFTGFAPPSVVVADRDRIRVLRGNPLAEQLNVPWTSLGALRVGDLRIGRTLAPTVDLDRVNLRILHDNGWSASFKYAEHILAELNGLRRQGASQRPPSGGKVSSTDAGRPPQGSSTATTEP